MDAINSDFFLFAYISMEHLKDAEPLGEKSRFLYHK